MDQVTNVLNETTATATPGDVVFITCPEGTSNETLEYIKEEIDKRTEGTGITVVVLRNAIVDVARSAR